MHCTGVKVDKLYTSMYLLGNVASILRELLNEDVVERIIRHEAQPSALLGLETTPEFNNFCGIRA